MKTSIITDNPHPFSRFDLTSSLCSRDYWIRYLRSRHHCQIQYIALKITCRNVLGLELLNTISFLLSHIAQHKAATPTNIRFLSFDRMAFNQESNMFTKLEGG